MAILYCIVTLCVKSPVIPQGNLIIGDALYSEAIKVLISQIPTLPQYSLYWPGVVDRGA